MKGGSYLTSSYKKLIKTIQRNWKIFFVVIVLTTISGYLLANYGLTKHYHTITELYIKSEDSETDAQKAATCQLLFTSPQMYNTLNLQLEQGFTYAEYARKGFFELCGVCCINAAVIAGMSFLPKHSGEKKPILLKCYTLFLAGSSLILAGTALAKMFLYIDNYGMTQLRIYTTWFMLLLMMVFLLVIIRQFKANLPVCKIGFAVFTVMFGLLCFSRPDAWMTRCNAEMYLAGELDEFAGEMVYHELSDDAAAVLEDDRGALHQRAVPRPRFLQIAQLNSQPNRHQLHHIRGIDALIRFVGIDKGLGIHFIDNHRGGSAEMLLLIVQRLALIQTSLVCMDRQRHHQRNAKENQKKSLKFFHILSSLLPCRTCPTEENRV